MFGLSWDQIILIVLAALFLLGPERIPTATKWIMDSLRKLRTMAAGAQDELRSQVGPELDELRRQVAELQSLKELGELRQLRELNPRAIIGKNILGDQFSGGVTGFLGLNGTGQDGENGAGESGNGAADGTAGGAVSHGSANAAEAGSGASEGADGALQSTQTPGTTTLTAPAPQRTLDAGERPPFDDEGT